MADLKGLTDAQAKFIGTLQIAGIIHPHAGMEKVVLDALDAFAIATADIPDRVEGSPRELVEQKFGEASEEIARLRYELAQAQVTITELIGRGAGGGRHTQGAELDEDAPGYLGKGTGVAPKEEVADGD